MARWMLYLSGFDIKLVHIPGKKNIQADVSPTATLRQGTGPRPLLF